MESKIRSAPDGIAEARSASPGTTGSSMPVRRRGSESPGAVPGRPFVVGGESDRFVRVHLKTRQLVLLVELGRHGSILHAAKATHLTQPAASKQLAELESALGVQLFKRRPRGVEPTPYGDVMIRRASAALSELDAAHQEVMGLASGLRGRVAVGSLPTPAVALLPEAVRRLKAGFGRLRVSVTVDTSERLLVKLRNGEVDIVIGRVADREADADLAFEPLSGEAQRLVVGAGHPLVGRGDLVLEDLAHLCWIMPPAGSLLRDRLAGMFLAHGLDLPSETVDAAYLPLAVELLSGSDSIAVLPESALRVYLDGGILATLPFDLRLDMDEIGVVTRRRQELSPGAGSLLTILRKLTGGAGVLPSAGAAMAA